MPSLVNTRSLTKTTHGSPATLHQPFPFDHSPWRAPRQGTRHTHRAPRSPSRPAPAPTAQSLAGLLQPNSDLHARARACGLQDPKCGLAKCESGAVLFLGNHMPSREAETCTRSMALCLPCDPLGVTTRQHRLIVRGGRPCHHSHTEKKANRQTAALTPPQCPPSPNGVGQELNNTTRPWVSVSMHLCKAVSPPLLVV